MKSEPSSQIVMQRLRNRIMDTLELAASAEDQREYQQNAPFVHVPYQVINWWEDFVGDDWRQHYSAGTIFTQCEIDALARFHAIWRDVANWLPDDPLEAILSMPEWQRLIVAARESFQVFLERGRLQEDVEMLPSTQ